MSLQSPVVLLLSCQSLFLLNAACEVLAQDRALFLHAVIGFEPLWLRHSRRLHSLIQLPSRSCAEPQLLEAVLQAARSVGADVIVPVATDDVAFVSRHRIALSSVARPICVPDPRLMESVAQKLKFARLAETIGLPVPRTVEITPGLTPQAVTTQLGFPMLRKPVIGMSGGGIELIRDEAALRSSLGEPGVAGQFMLQEKVPGEDVALTLLADRGEVFAVMLRKRWFTRRKATAFAPIQDVEFFACEWLEHLGRRFVAATQYSGIADFDLKVDFERRRAWFLESDPRFMGGLAGAERFGLNVPLLLIARTLGLIPPGTCVRTTSGHFLSTPSIPEWLVSGGWRRPRHGRICTNLRTQLSDPLATIARMKDFVVHSF